MTVGIVDVVRPHSRHGRRGLVCGGGNGIGKGVEALPLWRHDWHDRAAET